MNRTLVRILIRFRLWSWMLVLNDRCAAAGAIVHVSGDKRSNADECYGRFIVDAAGVARGGFPLTSKVLVAS